jgi:hypothetical protein
MVKNKRGRRSWKMAEEILKVLCDKFKVDEILPDNVIIELFPKKNIEDIIKKLYYFRGKGYLSFDEFHRKDNSKMPINIKLQSSAFDFVEKKSLKSYLLNILKKMWPLYLIKYFTS